MFLRAVPQEHSYIHSVVGIANQDKNKASKLPDAFDVEISPLHSIDIAFSATLHERLDLPMICLLHMDGTNQSRQKSARFM